MQCCSYFWTKQSIKNKPWRQTDIKTTAHNYVFLIFIWTHSRLCVGPHQTVSPRLKEHLKTLTFARHRGASVGTLPVHLHPPPQRIHRTCKSNETARWRCMQLYVMPAFLLHLWNENFNVLLLNPSDGFFLLVKSDRNRWQLEHGFDWGRRGRGGLLT